MIKLFRCPNEHCHALTDEFIIVKGDAIIHSVNDHDRACDVEEIHIMIPHDGNKITIAFCKYCGTPVPFYEDCIIEKDRVYDYDDV